MHGGANGSGAPSGKRNGNSRHGYYTQAAIAERQMLRAWIKSSRSFAIGTTARKHPLIEPCFAGARGFMLLSIVTPQPTSQAAALMVSTHSVKSPQNWGAPQGGGARSLGLGGGALETHGTPRRVKCRPGTPPPPLFR